MTALVESFKADNLSSGRWVYVTASAGRAVVEIAFGPEDVWVVVKNNASHRAFKGLGRRFSNVLAALDGYKRADVRAAVEAAAMATRETFPGQVTASLSTMI